MGVINEQIVEPDGTLVETADDHAAASRPTGTAPAVEPRGSDAMLSFAIAVAIMLAVVGGSVQWAARAERRRNLREEGHARHH